MPGSNFLSTNAGGRGEGGRTLGHLLASAIFLGLPAAALGQDASRISDPAAVPREVGKFDEAVEAQRVMNDYGSCILQRSRRRAEAALRKVPGSKWEDQAMRKLASPDCLSDGVLSFQPGLFRGSLFEALYEADFKTTPVAAADAPPVDYSAGADAPITDEVRVQVALRQFADCVVRSNASAARALVLSKVGSAAEGDSFQQLMPAMSRCLAKGVELNFTRPVLRGLIAETLYRLSRAAASSSVSQSR